MHPRRKPDPAWKYIDANGHAHCWWKDELPTLEEVVTGTTFVGDEYDGEEVDDIEHRCRICGEVVVPKHILSYEPSYVAGPPEYTLFIRGNELQANAEYRIPDDDVAPLIEILRRVFA
jgi:hypothetical protein